MTPEQLDLLENESVKGRLANSAYENFIGPFMQEKRDILYTAFQDISIHDIEMLTEVKRQLLVLNNLDQEIKTIIETGKMASQQLSLEPTEKH